VSLPQPWFPKFCFFLKAFPATAGDEPVDLFMLLPHALANRLGHLPPLRTSKQVGPGYFQAPGKESLTICFTSILNLSAIQTALPDDSKQMLKLLCSCVRHELRQWGGYECEEHSGDFLVAFDDPKSAIMWALAVQVRIWIKPECQAHGLLLILIPHLQPTVFLSMLLALLLVLIRT